ncbi:amidohydrolase family protein [Novipirellula caenicola]|uniref:amidohydrolase family protein n=1 Tax=Novipirellula caenicola TaxID=1536901 RepID=UPI0031EA7F96
MLAQTGEGRRSAATRPIDSLRQADPSPTLLEGAEIVTHPGATPKVMSLLIDGTTIIRVASEMDVPPGAKRIDVSGKRIYAGLIDAFHEVELPEDPVVEGTGYWNRNITPEYHAAWVSGDKQADDGKRRSQGITTQLLAPSGGILKGRSCVVLLTDADHPQRLLRPNVFQHATLTVPRGKKRDSYPTSPMGATALLRQALYDAVWYRDANRVYQRNTSLNRPEPSLALDQLSHQITDGRFLFDADNERMAIRAEAIADEFSLDILLRGSGREYRGLDEIAATGRSFLLPVDFPKVLATETLASINDSTLTDWIHWYFAPENPQRLHAAGVEFALTTDGLDDPQTFLKQVRVAVDRGLPREIALAAMTTTPAKLLGVEDRVGEIKPGMLANLVITDGDLLDDSTKVLETWVAGVRYEIAEDAADDDGLEGVWSTPLTIDGKRVNAELVFEQNEKSFSGYVRLAKKKSDKKAKLEKLIRQRDRVSASIKLHSLSDSFDQGVWQLTVLRVQEDDPKSPRLMATLLSPSGVSERWLLKRIEDSKADPNKKEDPSKKEEPAKKAESAEKVESAEKTKSSEAGQEIASVTDPIELVYPLGAFGLTEPPEQPALVMFRGATVWTCGDDGVISPCDVLVRGGVIAEVGQNLKVPKDCVQIDANGKHITPGMIDCHSHMATDGGINEAGQAVTSEVRVEDFIDNTDITIYRQLAGGVTSANILHGSANPIGGQSQVIKLRWGGTMQALKFAEAPLGIKFALGENVKRKPNRYPTTRMGVEQILRDQFLAARQYEAANTAWHNGVRDQLPPRRDLQLDALVEIQRGDRWIHCHSYRQDEIVATLDVLEEFNIRIGTLQHILEGYKVADRIAEHGAMASTFADWWAYKFEVYDAVPYNGVLMHDAGIVVSYNSDDPELGRHLNTEAAKATKYGGVPEQEALKFVTLNPAKQLRIDDRVGSIEAGKDADLVVWSGRPLSTTSRCEQTWIDGRRYFDVDQDRKLRQRDRELRSRIIQIALQEPKQEKPQDEKDKVEEEDRWTRIDVFCNAGRNAGGVQ